MRKPSYLSSSQLSLWERNREDYVIQHLATARPDSMPQTLAMSIGSSFDAYVKSSMYEHLFGKGTNPQFEFDTIFREQVAEENRDWALENGSYLFDCYRTSGAYDDLLKLLEGSQHAPQFEFTVEGVVGGVPLLGKPDLRFVHKGGAHVILDWKVSGYASKYGASPAKNYQLVRDGWVGNKPSKSNGLAHKGYEPINYKNLEIGKKFLEEANTTWATQIIMYGWLLGEEVGDENVIACIDQLVAKPTGTYPLIRVAAQRARTSKQYQLDLLKRLQSCWTAIETSYIFDDLSQEESKARCELLDRRAEVLYSESEGLESLQKFLIEDQLIYKF